MCYGIWQTGQRNLEQFATETVVPTDQVPGSRSDETSHLTQKY